MAVIPLRHSSHQVRALSLPFPCPVFLFFSLSPYNTRPLPHALQAGGVRAAAGCVERAELVRLAAQAGQSALLSAGERLHLAHGVSAAPGAEYAHTTAEQRSERAVLLAAQTLPPAAARSGGSNGGAEPFVLRLP
eukprot:CAMPEP_0179949846 /NCGR_PEP_ID=MMETSP0983-20121128/22577_1 /TAXON_ID=483367 /ORGANISM="non described non described, Strain CCMP 2436" /LENGTH=134 /DNA_ID=CAMNT_0021859661 /DNA_START=30 /DNA_END=434 /DNA_ORIENTATION=-